jgi:pimeloyl-ACP methyl ester carboxylesterase
MKRRTFVAGVTASSMFLVRGAVGMAQEDAGTATPVGGATMTKADGQSGYATVNGLDMYYEIHGAGEPLVLLHGGFMTAAMLAELATALAQSRQVIAVDLEGHGHTRMLDRPLRYEQMADDVVALVEHLGLSQVDVAGYSLGGGVTLQLAIRHPDLVRKLVVISAPYANDGWYPEVLKAMGETITPDMMKEYSPYYAPYIEAAPNPEDWPAFVDKVRVLLAEDTYNWADGVAAIEKPTLLIFGDADSVRPEHIVELFQMLGGGVPGDLVPMPPVQLAILPGTAHSAAYLDTGTLTAMITAFLDAPLPEAG